MHEILRVDRCLVAIFDIVGYTKKDLTKQTYAVNTFIESLNKKLEKLKMMSPDAYPTGDGAIVSIGVGCKISDEIIKKFIDFVIDFLIDMTKLELIVRVSVNYNELDKILMTDKLNIIHGKYIQIGDTINIASRIITFAENKEILVNESFYKLIRKIGLLEFYEFIKNTTLKTKHGETLETYSYVPKQSEELFIYNPKCPEHEYKKYYYFPPVNSEIVRFFMKTGLDYELQKFISHAFESIKNLNYTTQIISNSNVLNVLTQLNYDPEDTVYVLNRIDREASFWTQPMKEEYIKYLTLNTGKHNKVLNQIRIRIYNPDGNIHTLLPKKDIHFDLLKLHNENTYFNAPNTLLYKYSKLNELHFGVTVSSKYKYAIIPIPSPESMAIDSKPIENNIGALLDQFKNYNQEFGPMKALITANEPYVDELLNDFKMILKENRMEKLK